MLQADTELRGIRYDEKQNKDMEFTTVRAICCTAETTNETLITIQVWSFQLFSN